MGGAKYGSPHAAFVLTGEEISALESFRLGGGLRVPAFFGFEAYPSVVADILHRSHGLAEREIAFAQKPGDIFAVFFDRILEVDMPDEFLEHLGRHVRLFAFANGMLDIPQCAHFLR